jgi:hypothetical protein
MPSHLALPVAEISSLPHREGRCAAQQNWPFDFRSGSKAARAVGAGRWRMSEMPGKPPLLYDGGGREPWPRGEQG